MLIMVKVILKMLLISHHYIENNHSLKDYLIYVNRFNKLATIVRTY